MGEPIKVPPSLLEELSPEGRASYHVHEFIHSIARQLFGPGAKVMSWASSVSLDLIEETWPVEPLPTDMPIGSRFYTMPLRRYDDEADEGDEAYEDWSWRFDHKAHMYPGNVMFRDPDGGFVLIRMSDLLWFTTGQNRSFGIQLLIGPADADFPALVKRCEEYVRDKIRGRKLMIGVGTSWAYRPIPEASWDDLVLPEDLISTLKRSIQSFLDGEAVYREFNVPYRRGILLAGPPGNGKSTITKVVASTCGRTVIYWQISDETDDDDVERVFSLAERYAPSVVIAEELDAIQGCRVSRSTFLNTLDGFTAPKGVLLLGTTNYPEHIDPALVGRAGRFDRLFVLPQPTEPLRYKQLHRLLGHLFPTQEIARLAEATDGLSFAQLGELRTDTCLRLAAGDAATVTDLIELVQTFKLSGSSDPEEWGKSRRSIGFAASKGAESRASSN